MGEQYLLCCLPQSSMNASVIFASVNFCVNFRTDACKAFLKRGPFEVKFLISDSKAGEVPSLAYKIISVAVKASEIIDNSK